MCGVLVEEDQEPFSAEVLRGLQGRGLVVVLYLYGSHPGPSGTIVLFSSITPFLTLQLLLLFLPFLFMQLSLF